LFLVLRSSVHCIGPEFSLPTPLADFSSQLFHSASYISISWRFVLLPLWDPLASMKLLGLVLEHGRDIGVGQKYPEQI